MKAARSTNLAQALNHSCVCATLDRSALEREFFAVFESNELYRSLPAQHPHLFSETGLFVTPEQAHHMQTVIKAIESVIATPAYRQEVRQRASVNARKESPALGVFLGYDFHLNDEDTRLIEINTNAGGALLNLYLARAQRACCPQMHGSVVTPTDLISLETQIVAMFRNEWRLARGDAPLHRIALIDDAPQAQYLFPEFLLFQALFRKHGIDVLVADAADVVAHAGQLWAHEQSIDLVYNRSTDFELIETRHTALQTAWLEDLALITPHPRAHALYADKRNLILLTDERWLEQAGIPAATVEILLQGIARTRLVEPALSESLWTQRKQLFFKPSAGYGGKAVYRGDKLTRRVWEEILAGDYVMQQLVPPGERAVQVQGEVVSLKHDVRNFVYNGDVQLLCARLYRGQATNLRTPGGGFAPVFYPSPERMP